MRNAYIYKCLRLAGRCPCDSSPWKQVWKRLGAKKLKKNIKVLHCGASWGTIRFVEGQRRDSQAWYSPARMSTRWIPRTELRFRRKSAVRSAAGRPSLRESPWCFMSPWAKTVRLCVCTRNRILNDWQQLWMRVSAIRLKFCRMKMCISASHTGLRWTPQGESACPRRC